MTKLFKHYTLGFLAVLFTIAGCAQQSGSDQNGPDSNKMKSSANLTMAVAHVHATDGGNPIGTVTFEKVSEGVKVHAEVSGLQEGKHGFHIHQYGDCTAEDQTSAGGHYNPYEMEHGAPTDSVRHMGDMGNLPVDAEGSGTLDYIDSVIELNGPNSIIGRAVIIHGGSDDFTSQPSGAAGPRMACGVIGVTNPGQ